MLGITSSKNEQGDVCDTVVEDLTRWCCYSAGVGDNAYMAHMDGSSSGVMLVDIMEAVAVVCGSRNCPLDTITI